jgi:ATP-dependent DNA ligase
MDLFRGACERDLEGVVGKWTNGSYLSDSRTTSWVKIKNPC